MSGKEELGTLRQRIDEVDASIIALFNERMAISENVAAVKSKYNIAVKDDSREQQVIDRAMAASQDANKADAAALMRTLMALSRLRQGQKLMPGDGVDFPPSAAPTAETPAVAFQGVAGSWGEHAARQLFPGAHYTNVDYFEDAFEAVKAGSVQYGVLPIENSQSGAIGEVYDLLKRHGCYIVGQMWITVAQCLLALDGAAQEGIREVFSHPEGFSQCKRFLKNKHWDLTACRNTAYGAQMVKEKGDSRFAAIGSRRAAQVHGLKVLVPDIMDNPLNRTRFIAIAREPIYDANSDTLSVTFSTAHKSGALCAVLQAFSLAGLNLTRIESRPVSPEHYRFFVDLQANVLDGACMDALRQAAMHCDYFEVLGCCRLSREDIALGFDD